MLPLRSPAPSTSVLSTATARFVAGSTFSGRDPGDELRRLRSGVPLRQARLRSDGEARAPPLQGPVYFCFARWSTPGPGICGAASSCSARLRGRPADRQPSSRLLHAQRHHHASLACGTRCGDVEYRRGRARLRAESEVWPGRGFPRRAAQARPDASWTRPAFRVVRRRRLRREPVRAAPEAAPSLALAAGWYWIRKLQGRFLALDYGAALDAAARAETLLWTARFLPRSPNTHFTRAWRTRRLRRRPDRTDETSTCMRSPSTTGNCRSGPGAAPRTSRTGPR